MYIRYTSKIHVCHAYKAKRKERKGIEHNIIIKKEDRKCTYIVEAPSHNHC